MKCVLCGMESGRYWDVAVRFWGVTSSLYVTKARELSPTSAQVCDPCVMNNLATRRSRRLTLLFTIGALMLLFSGLMVVWLRDDDRLWTVVIVTTLLLPFLLVSWVVIRRMHAPDVARHLGWQHVRRTSTQAKSQLLGYEVLQSTLDRVDNIVDGRTIYYETWIESLTGSMGSRIGTVGGEAEECVRRTRDAFHI